MRLFQNESIITKSDSDAVVLTTHRIRLQDGGSLTSIMLDQISGIEVRNSSKPVYMFLAIIFGIGGIYMLNETDGTIATGLFIIAAVLVFLFIDSRKHVVSIASSSTKIIFHTKGMGKEAVLDFVDKIEEGKSRL